MTITGFEASFLPPLDEVLPTRPGLAPNVAVGVDQHHHCPNQPTRLKEQYPSPVEKEEDGAEKFDSVAAGLDEVDGVVKLLPGAL